MILGWRKIGAWALIFALTVYCTVSGNDIPPEAKGLLWAATLFFFGANVASKLAPSVREGKEPS